MALALRPSSGAEAGKMMRKLLQKEGKVATLVTKQPKKKKKIHGNSEDIKCIYGPLESE